jgi:hypothetical protein
MVLAPGEQVGWLYVSIMTSKDIFYSSSHAAEWQHKAEAPKLLWNLVHH